MAMAAVVPADCTFQEVEQKYFPNQRSLELRWFFV